MNKEKAKKIFTVIWYVLNGLLAVVLLMSAYGGMVSPDWSTIPAILAMTFPFWLGLSLLAGLVSLLFNRKASIIQGVAILCSLGPLLSYCPLNFFPRNLTPQEEARSFTLLSYNVYGLNDYRNPLAGMDEATRAAERAKPNETMLHILEQDADVVCLQEFYLNLPHKQNPLTAALRDSVIARYPYRVTGEESAILSKYPLYKVPMEYKLCRYQFCLAAVANIQGHRTLLVCVHMESIGLDSSDRELYQELTSGEGGTGALKKAKTQLISKLSRAFRSRAMQARLARSEIDSLGYENVIITGDFNDIPDCYAMRQLAGHDFKNAFTMAGCGPMITYHASHFYFHIDHTLYRGDMEAVNFRRDNYSRSDHYPIMTRFLWNRDASADGVNTYGIDLLSTDSVPAEAAAH